jgi:hypothetical protein
MLATKHLILILTIVAGALCAIPAGAVTVVPSGVYSGQLTTICQGSAQTANTKIIQSSVNPIYSSVSLKISSTNTVSFASAQHLVTNSLISSALSSNGEIQQTIAQVTFTPASAGKTTGKISGRLIQTSGSLVAKGDGSSGDFAVSPQNVSDSFSVTATTLTLGSTTYQAIFTKPSAAGVPNDIDIIGIGNKNGCSAAGHFSNQ